MLFYSTGFLILILLLSFTSFEIRKEIILQVPVKKVWEAIVSFENYKNWNSQLSYLGGRVSKNEILHLKLSVQGAQSYEFKPKVSHFIPFEKFAWLARTANIPRLFDGEHFFELTSMGENQTRVVNREKYSGVLSLFMKQLPMMKLAPEGFEKMNEQLKNWLEKNEGAPKKT